MQLELLRDQVDLCLTSRRCRDTVVFLLFQGKYNYRMSIDELVKMVKIFIIGCVLYLLLSQESVHKHTCTHTQACKSHSYCHLINAGHFF